MFGKPQWFKRRKYGGWGLMPATWQGWVYAVIAVAPLVLVQYATFLPGAVRPVVMAAWAVLIAVDIIHIMTKVAVDERERLHEAVAERNALWAIIAILCAGVGYQAATSAVLGSFSVDPVILIAIFGAVVVKAGTNIYLDARD